MTQPPCLKTQQMQVGGMDCTSCAMKIEGSLEKLAGIAEVSVVVATGRLTIAYYPNQVDEAEIKKRVTDLGYTVDAERPKPSNQAASHDSKNTHEGHDHSKHSYAHKEDEDEDGEHDHEIGRAHV